MRNYPPFKLNVYTVVPTIGIIVILILWIQGLFLSSTKTQVLRSESEQLYMQWAAAYNLKPQGSRDGSSHGIPERLAPHLDDCERLTKERLQAETRKRNGDLPDWAVPTPPQNSVYPPWVRGADDENIGLTRLIQTLLWKQQFPQNCSDPSLNFALIPWPTSETKGLGSVLHVFSSQLSVAFTQGRIAVPLPGTFTRANDKNCPGRTNGSLECFFFPLTSPECEEVALSILRLPKKKRRVKKQVVVFKRLLRKNAVQFNGPVEKPWLLSPITVELFGEMIQISNKTKLKWLGNETFPWNKVDERFIKTNWWHSQAIRFMLRWPSESLCRATNKVRHEAFGMEVARKFLEIRASQKFLAGRAGRVSKVELKVIRESSQLADKVASLENSLWWKEEPFLPRPILSVHIRQGDKGKEMFLFSMVSYMWLAERLRKHVPNLKNVWLSTEMESVIEESQSYKDWKFYYTKNKRQRGQLEMYQYSSLVGEKELAEISFANLIIASQCDYFVGGLGSNWNRLINELRLTNGRLKSGLLSVNMEEW